MVVLLFISPQSYIPPLLTHLHTFFRLLLLHRKRDSGFLSASSWDLVYTSALNSNLGKLDFEIMFKMFAVHVTLPFGFFLAWYFFGYNAVRWMKLDSVTELLISVLFIMYNVCYAVFGFLFPAEIALINFVVLFRATMIAVKYGYMAKVDLVVWNQPFDEEKCKEFHKTQNMISGWWSLNMHSIYRELGFASVRSMLFSTRSNFFSNTFVLRVVYIYLFTYSAPLP
jgi:hypothetical protein